MYSFDLPQCSQCLLTQEPQESREAYQLPVTKESNCLIQTFFHQIIMIIINYYLLVVSIKFIIKE